MGDLSSLIKPIVDDFSWFKPFNLIQYNNFISLNH
jgi:hypothetical protein